MSSPSQIFSYIDVLYLYLLCFFLSLKLYQDNVSILFKIKEDIHNL
jgi:hypothetical protein